jgi:asparagine synthase (glutamine-hydrolysing)
MCGICGVLARQESVLGQRLRRMNDAQQHRGPDGEGYYIDRTHPLLLHDQAPSPDEVGLCGLAHRRLAILDPMRGQQPMVTPDRRFAILLNGEIYNFESLRKTLAYPFRTDCDTEVVLALCAQEPEHPERWLSRLEGIFALAVWDRQEKRLLLARDPYGVKPLHVTHDPSGNLLFSSEIKSLLTGGVPARLNRAALHVFLNVRYVPGRETLFEGVMRFPPGHYAWMNAHEPVRPIAYYELPGVSGQGLDREAVCRQIRQVYDRAVRDQLLSDVPVGISLSGGLDSSMNVVAADYALRQTPGLRAGDRRLRTFTLGFNEPTDELDDAAIVAQQFQTLHTSQCLSLDPLGQMRDVIRAVEEPKVNMLQGYALAALAGKDVKVLLSGLGGDELFAGYDIHRFCNTLGRLHAITPLGLQRTILGPLGTGWWWLQERSGALRWEHYRIGGQIALSVGDRAQFYARLRNAWDYDKRMYARLYEQAGDFLDVPATGSYFQPYFSGSGDYLDQVLRAEFQTKMVNDFLVNEDRVCSAHGVEGRVPFLDKQLVELAMSIPSPLKMQGAGTKALWRDSIGNTLPETILQKKKQGFTFSSYHQWEKDLRSVVQHELLDSGWCEDAGLFRRGFVEEIVAYPAHPNLRWHYFMLWMMVGVKAWMEIFDVRSE